MPDTVETAIYRLGVEGQEKLDQAARSLDQVAASEEKVTRATRTTMDGLERMIASLDKRVRAEQQLGRSLEQLQRYENEGVGSAARRGEALRLVTQRYNDQAEAISRIGARITELTAKFDPATASARRMTAEIAELNQAQRAGVNIAGGYSAALDSIVQKYDLSAQAAKRAAVAQADMIAQARASQAAQNAQLAQGDVNRFLGVNPSSGAGSAAASAAVFQEAFQQQERLATAAQKYRDQLNPLLPLQRAYKAELAGINEVAAAGLLTDAQRIATIQRTKDAFAGQVVALRSVRDETQETTKRFALNRIGLLELQAAGINSFQALASGMNPLRIATMEGAQVFGAFAQGGLGVTGILKAMVSPIGLAIAGITGLAAGFGLLLLRASSVDERLRLTTATLRGMGTDSLATARDLEETGRRLRDLGINTAQAEAIKNAVIRTPGINPLATDRLAPLSVNIATRTGEEAEAVAKGLATAFATSTTAATRMVQELLGPNGLDPAVAQAARTMSEAGDRAGAAALLVKQLEDRFGGLRKEALGPAGDAFTSMGAAWQNMLDRLSETGPIQAAKRAIIDMLTAVGDAASGKTVQSPTPAFLQGINRSIRQGIYSGASFLWNQLPDFGSATANQQDMASALAARNGGLSVGGALSSVALPSANIGGLNSAFSSRLDAWLDSLPDQERALIRISGAYRDAQQQAGLFAGSDGSGRMVAAPGGSAHGFGIAADIRGMSPAARASLEQFGLHTPMPWEPWHVEPSETLNAATATAAQRRQSFQAFVSGQSGGIVSNAISKDDQTALDEARERFNRLNDAAAKFGTEGVRAKAYWEAFYASSKDGDARNLEAKQKADEAVAALNTELQKAATIQDQQTAGVIRSADAFKQSQAAGYASIAAEQARIEVMQKGGDVALRTRQILEEGAASAILSGRQQVAAALPQVAAAERLAEAARQGAAAEHEQDLINQAAARTQDALAKAEASRNPVLIAQAKALNDAALAEIRRSDAAQQAKRFADLNTQDRNQIEVIGTQIALQGQTAEVIARQVSLVQAKQQLEAAGLKTTDDDYQLRLRTVAALGDQNIALANATREQSRLDDGIRSVASTVENTLTKSIEDAFSGAKVESWGKRIKSMLGSLVAQISDALFIKPLLGSIIGGLGFGSAAQGFGSLFGSSSGGLLSGLFGSSTSSPVATLTPNGSGGFNIQTLGQAAGVVKDVAGGGIFGSGSSSGGLFSNTTSWINNNIGTSLGFAPSGLVNGSGMGAGIFTDIGTGITSDVAGGGVASGLFGGTTLTGFLGGAGAGFGLGSLLNSFLGGNKLLGSVGSGVGSLAGAAIGSIFPGVGTLLGGLLGGGLGGLFGLFGAKKPPNQSAGGNIDFSTGNISGTFAGGNQQIDSATQGALRELSSFTRDLLRVSGGSLTGGILFQGGVNTGFGVDSTVPGYTGNFRLGKDAGNAVQVVELALARTLTGVSDTMKQVINTVTDPAQLHDAIQFAQTYDNLKEAFDNAFSSISQDTKTLGPFGQALDQLNSTFDDLTQKATQYGLSLDPITAGLAEATKRLKSDFQTALEQMASGDNGQFLGAAQAAHQQFIQNQNDAAALGFTDAATAAKIAAIETEQLGAALGALDLASLQKAVTTFADTAPEVSQFAQALIDSAQFLPDQITQLTLAITDPVTLAIDKEKLAGAERVRIAQATGQDIIAINKYNQLALDQIWNQATASLVSLQTDLLSGASSGLTAAQQVTAANDNFTKELALVQAGNLAEITNFATAASNLIQLSTQTYGNAPQTADIRTSILTAIDQVLSQNGFASGTLATPPGTILVGERGPELISQPGGLRVWSNPETERLLAMMPSRHFADGTDFLPALPSFTTSRPANDALVAEVRALRTEVKQLLEGNMRVAQGVGSAVVGKLGDVHGAIEEGNQPGFVEPPRRRVA